ncbi:MAG TPA: hypothetical protein VHE81_17510 [Lacipirellulaceae bacterium]|nr:hypothetical protein [Lacipirellulaceae bacterium]
MKSEGELRITNASSNVFHDHRRSDESPGRALDPRESAIEPDESSELDESDMGETDDERWEVFILDDDECEPLPEYGDFWLQD